MSFRRFLLIGLALGAIGACADNGVGTIDYQLSGGLLGERATVHIDSSGEMTRVKRDGTTDTATLDAAALAELHRQVDDAMFPTLAAEYMCNCADDLLHTIAVHVDGGAYTVMVSSLAEYPDRLTPLIDTLSSMSQGPIPPN